MKKNIILIMGHLLFWSLSVYVITRIFGISSFEVFEENTNDVLVEKTVITYDHQFTWATLITASLSALIFYLNFFVLLRQYFREKNLGRYIFKLLGLIAFAIILDVLLNRFLNYGVVEHNDDFLFPSFGLHMGLFIFYTAISFAYAFTMEWYKNEKLRGIISQEKLNTELNFLKSQVNPHFLFNTLNNLFSIAQKHKVDELSTGINELSNLMRYMLYESNADFVPLKKEVKYIESFIEIQQLRHDEEDELIINFIKEGKFDSVVIAPMILLPFVENAFKHGFSLNDSSVINFNLRVDNEKITFKAKNKAFKLHKFSDKTSGIGLENVTRRLNLIYPEKHSLRIYEDKGYFFVELNISTNG